MEWNAKGWIFARIFSVLLSVLLERHFAVMEVWLCLMGLPFCYHFYLNGLQSWLPVRWYLEKTKRQRIGGQSICGAGVKKTDPFRSYNCWGSTPFLHTCVQKECPVYKDCATSGVLSTKALLGSLLLSFGGGGLNKAVEEENSVEFRAQQGNSWHSGGCGRMQTAGCKFTTRENSSGFLTVFFCLQQ